MPYSVWPTVLNNPDRPIQIPDALPLVRGGPKEPGQYKADRIRTRPSVSVKASIILEADEYQTLAAFWRDTLFNGKKLFTAPWIALAGYEGYTARLLGYSSSSVGTTPKVNLNLQFIPDVRLDVTDTFPEIWPPLP